MHMDEGRGVVQNVTKMPTLEYCVTWAWKVVTIFMNKVNFAEGHAWFKKRLRQFFNHPLYGIFVWYRTVYSDNTWSKPFQRPTDRSWHNVNKCSIMASHCTGFLCTMSRQGALSDDTWCLLPLLVEAAFTTTRLQCTALSIPAGWRHPARCVGHGGYLTIFHHSGQFRLAGPPHNMALIWHSAANHHDPSVATLTTTQALGFAGSGPEMVSNVIASTTNDIHLNRPFVFNTHS